MSNIKRTSMTVHHTPTLSTKDEWLTPPYIIKDLGSFELDPCSPKIRPWDTAKMHFTIEDDGLKKDWDKLSVFCNPPYGRETAKWLNKCKEMEDCIALIFARTETSMFFDHVWPYAHAILFIKGRLTFYNSNGTKPNCNAGAPSCLIAYGKRAAERLQKSSINGKLVLLKT